MTDSIRERIIQSLETQMQQLTAANGYDFTVPSGQIERARRWFETLPAIGIFDGDEIRQNDYGVTSSTMTVDVEFHADAGATNRSVFMNRMKANLEKAIMSADTYHGVLAEGTAITGFRLRLPADDDATEITVVAVVNIMYRTLTGNPYSQP